MRRASVVAPFFALAVVMTLVVLPSFATAGWPLDEGGLLVYPERLLAGAIPHRDYATLYGPGDVWVLAGASAVAGPSVVVERAVGLLFRLALVLALAVVIRRRDGLAAALAAAAIAIVFLDPTRLVAFAWVGGVALVIAAQAVAPRSPLLAGALAGAATLFRPDALIAGALGAAPLLVTRRSARAPWLAGLALGVAPWAVHLVLAGPGPVVQNLLLDVLAFSPGRRLPLPTSGPLLGILLLIVVALVLALVVGVRRWRAARDVDLLGLALVCVGILPQSLQRADLLHLGFVAAPTVPLLVPALAALVSWRTPRLHRVGVALALLLVAIAVPSIVLGTIAGAPAGYAVTNRDRSFPLLTPGRAADAQAMLAAVERIAHPGERLFVGPADLTRANYDDTYLYFLLPQLRPATYYLEMIPLVTNAPGSRWASDLASADVAILSTEYDDWREPNASADAGSDEPLRVLAERFTLRESIGPYRVYLRR